MDNLVIEIAVEQILDTIGEDLGREGLVETPARVARFWEEFIEYDPGKVDVTFEAVQTDQMIICKNIQVFSLCEHHLLPFTCDVSIAYIPVKSVIGLSKLARIAHKHAHKLQLQERLTRDIATEVQQITDSESVAVLTKGVHMCMRMRGIKSSGSMIVSDLRGKFKQPDRPGPREEFHRLLAL